AKVMKEKPLDDLMTLMCFTVQEKDNEEKLVGCIVHFSCHPVVCCTSFATPDYPGMLRNFIQNNLKGTPICIFLQGCSGDINPGSFLLFPEKFIHLIVFFEDLSCCLC